MPRLFMGFFKEQLEKEFNPTGVKRLKPKVVYSHKKQTGKRISLEADKKRKAMPPGKRISKTGRTYYEARRNRSDIQGLGI